MGRKKSGEPKKMGRPIKRNDPVRIVETGEVYSDYRAAAEAIHGNRGCVFLCAYGYRPQHRNYHFELASPEDLVVEEILNEPIT